MLIATHCRKYIYKRARQLLPGLIHPTIGLLTSNETLKAKQILVIQDQQVAGFSSVWLPDRFLHHLYLAPDRIGKGYGHLLLEQTMASVSGPMRLKCLARNHRALSFYKTHGWQIISEGHGDDGPYFEMEGVSSV